VKNILTSWGRGSEAVANFGQATLHRHRDGRCELLGGSAADHQAALEWAALFQHDAVFSVSGGTRLRRVVPGVSPGTRRTASLRD
jgi:hypothetical protein